MPNIVFSYNNAEPAFTEGFEVAAVENLLPDWTGAQLVRGTIDISTAQARTGTRSLVMTSENNIGKAHIFKAGYWLQAGNSASVTAYFYIPSGTNLDDLYLMDWESKSFWSDENTLPNTQPGIRVGLVSPTGGLILERGKMGIATAVDFFNGSFVMPRDQWVKFQWDIEFGIGSAGNSQIYVNDALIIDAVGTTYLDEAVADANGIIANEDYAFDRFKIGITANSTGGNLTMYLDDAEISVE